MDEHGRFAISDETAERDSTVVSVTGEIDMETSPSFHRGLLRALGAGRGGLVVDLSEASFLDSTALTSLTRVFDMLREKGGNLAIVAADPRVRALFDVARLDRDFEIFETRQEALAALDAHHTAGLAGNGA
jgi:anti-sigma B factor antagonist